MKYDLNRRLTVSTIVAVFALDTAMTLTLVMICSFVVVAPIEDMVVL